MSTEALKIRSIDRSRGRSSATAKPGSQPGGGDRMNAFVQPPSRAKSYANTPEEAAEIDPEALPGYHVDAINCALLRADSMLLMLSCQFTDEESCELHHSDISNVLWAVQGEIEMVRKLVEHGYETVGRGSK